MESDKGRQHTHLHQLRHEVHVLGLGSVQPSLEKETRLGLLNVELLDVIKLAEHQLAAGLVRQVNAANHILRQRWCKQDKAVSASNRLATGPHCLAKASTHGRRTHLALVDEGNDVFREDARHRLGAVAGRVEVGRNASGRFDGVREKVCVLVDLAKVAHAAQVGKHKHERVADRRLQFCGVKSVQKCVGVRRWRVEADMITSATFLAASLFSNGTPVEMRRASGWGAKSSYSCPRASWRRLSSREPPSLDRRREKGWDACEKVVHKSTAAARMQRRGRRH